MAVIIGIHGLANKPEEPELWDWWRKSLEEGLRRNKGIEVDVNFEGLYWAGVMYDRPIPRSENDEPYRPSTVPGDGPLHRYRDGWLDKLGYGALDLAGDLLDFGKQWLDIRRVGDGVLAAKLKDLSRYYTDEDIRKKLRAMLRDRLLDHRNTRTMLIAHSMGTIIAYDVLRAIGREDPTYRLAHFVTIGSPLGLPHVRDKIRRESALVRTPSVVEQWSNFADRRDPVALDVHLADDYAANDWGVASRDDLVINDYGGISHKSYGYLRTPELTDVVAKFV